MAIRLEKGQRINLEKNNGAKLTQFCVGCNWGSIIKNGFLGLGNSVQDVDLDLSCVMLDANGNLCDHIYSPLYRKEFLDQLHHSGDDLKGDQDGDDGLDNEIITVDLNKISSSVEQIFFFLNNCGKEDFSQIPYASIRMYEGTPEWVKEIFAQYDVAAESQYQGKTALIMGKLYRRGGEWKFSAIGDAYPDGNLCETIKRIITNYK